MVRYLSIVILIALVTAGCEQQQIPISTLDPDAPCDEIVHPALLDVPFNELEQGSEEAEEWILTKFPTVTIEFTPSQREGQGAIGQLTWSVGDTPILLNLEPTSNYVYIHTQQYPALEHVLRCFGDPDNYMVEWNVPVTAELVGDILTLWYPDRGLKFRSINQGLRQQRFDTTSALNDGIVITLPGPVEDLIWRWTVIEKFVQERLAALQEWPENFTEFVPDDCEQVTTGCSSQAQESPLHTPTP